MTRGDQRERDRAKRQAKEAQKAKPKEGRPDQRNAADAAKLAAKVEAKRAKEAAAAQQADTGPTKVVVPKKKLTTVKNDNLDDLLSAGLTSGKKKIKS